MLNSYPFLEFIHLEDIDTRSYKTWSYEINSICLFVFKKRGDILEHLEKS